MNQSIENRYMEFRLGDHLYAIPLLVVKEVISKPEVTPVLSMPPHFEGMINLRGQILGVFNVRKRLTGKGKDSKESASEPNHEVVIVVEQLGVMVGMIVDEVTRVLHASPEEISAAPLKKDDPAHQYIASVIQDGSNLIQTIDTGYLLELNKYTSKVS